MARDWIYHNSQDLFYRNPFGAVPCDQDIELKITLQCTSKVDTVLFVHWQEGKEKNEIKMNPSPFTQGAGAYTTLVTTPPAPGLVWYYFMIVTNGRIYYYGNNNENRGGVGRISETIPNPYQITVYKQETLPSKWFHDAVIYQIFVDRFFNGNEDGKVYFAKKNSLIHSHWENDPIYIKDEKTGRIARWDFFGGNLLGVKKKLSYLKGLGIKVIYFNPIFEAQSNHKYDTGDYHKIDPMYGTEEIFSELVKEANKLGIVIILDGVFSHTGSDSIYFNKEGNYPSIGAFQSKNSQYFSWYRFNEYPHWYDCWWGIDLHPNVNELDPSYQNFVIYDENSVVKHWLRNGVKGWRLDVADELPDTFIKRLKAELKKVDSEAILIGEVWEDASNKVSYGKRREYLLGEELDSVMNYPFRQTIIDFILGNQDAFLVHSSFMSIYENYPLHHFYSLMNLLGSHDVPRILTLFQEDVAPPNRIDQKKQVGIKRVKLAILWQMTFPGVPSLYYGDEAGLEGDKDPLNRRGYPWGRENQELIEWTKELVAIRDHYDVFRTGGWVSIPIESDVYGFIREIHGEKDLFGQPRKSNFAVIVINRSTISDKNITFNLPKSFTGELINLLNPTDRVMSKEGVFSTNLEPLEGKVFIHDLRSTKPKDERLSGILLHPTSFPAKFGIGDFGLNAFKWIDRLQRTGQKIWQILPLNPTGYGESPYQSFSAFAGNSLLLDIEDLIHKGYLTVEDIGDVPNFSPTAIDYQKVIPFKQSLYRKAFKNFKKIKKSADYQEFLTKHKSWLEDYALFMAFKEKHGGKAWVDWEPKFKKRELSAIEEAKHVLVDEIEYHKFLQYHFFQQWLALKTYANQKGIKIIGDLPIFVAHDSCDVWMNPHLFQLDDDGLPTHVAGVPPDYFSPTGQRWGNPLYNWSEMEKDNYFWWRQRIELITQMVDYIRIDHFRGFIGYWQIPANEATAINGEWVKGPGGKFFTALQEIFGDLPIIAEDLGVITPDVEEVKTEFEYPGMNIMQYAMNPNDSLFHLPLHKKNTVVYTGTHDNEPIKSWIEKWKDHLKFKGMEGNQVSEEPCWKYIEMAYQSNAWMVIIPFQDILCLGEESRMNTPSTVGGNWKWRFTSEQLTTEIEKKIRELTSKAQRNFS